MAHKKNHKNVLCQPALYIHWIADLSHRTSGVKQSSGHHLDPPAQAQSQAGWGSAVVSCLVWYKRTLQYIVAVVFFLDKNI